MATGRAKSIARRNASRTSSAPRSSSTQPSTPQAPTTVQTSAGMETAAQTLGRAQTLLASSKASMKAPKPFDPVIKAGNIGAETPALPTPTTSAGAPDVGALNFALGNPATGTRYDSTIGGFTVDPVTGAELNNMETRQSKYIADLKALYETQPSAVDIQKKLDRQTGIDSLKAQEAEYTGQIDAIVKNAQAEALGLEGQGRGITESIIGGQQAQINREAAIQALPIQAQLAGVQGKIQVATDYINKWGTLLLQDATNKYNNQVKSIEAVYNFGTAQDKLKFDSLRAQVKEKKDREVALATAKTNAIKQALSQPGGQSVVQAIQNATDENGVVTALGRFNGDVLAQEAQQASINATRALAAQRSGAVRGVGTTINAASDLGLTGSNEDPMLSIIAGSKGGRLLTQSEAEPLTNAKRVADGLADLQAVISTTNTDPILGLFQQVNPYNLNARAIDTAINTLVPQLARGTYGEVGVLTDSDMSRYANTLPNLTSTEEQNKAVMALTLRKVRSGFASQAESMAAAGRDVSGYADIYSKFNQQIQRLESEIGIGAPANNADLDAEFDSAFGNNRQTTPQTSESPGFWKSIGKFFFGE